jgi:hypothetical protein
MVLSSGTDNIIAALGHSNRVCQVFLMGLASWQLEKVLALMQVPFPELTILQLWSHEETPPVIPDSFLGGSAPRLQQLWLCGIPFPGLPKVLLSSNRLVSLWLADIPHSGYISPEAMVSLLSVLSSLISLSLEFESPQSRPDRGRRSLPPEKRSILPVLDYFRFKGTTDYLEDLVTFIGATQLKTLHITFFNQIDFDCPRLAQFINYAPTLRARDEAYVQFGDCTASIKLRYRTSKFDFDHLLIKVSCREPDLQLSSVFQVCNFSLPPASTVEDLYIEQEHSEVIWEGAIENPLWLELLLPFTAVKNLYLSEQFAPGIAAALQELIGDRITEVLPGLRNIFVERLELPRPFQKNIGQFFSARQLSDHPVAISDWPYWHKYSELSSWRFSPFSS